jgi:ATP-dependent DNA ligase
MNLRDINIRPTYIDIPVGQIPEGYDSFELKYDGIWGCMTVDAGKVSILSRNNNTKYRGETDCDMSMVLFGEYVGITYHAFDIAHFNGHDIRNMTLKIRKSILELAVENLHLPWVKTTQTFSIDRFEEVWKNAPGFEGVVWKNSESPFGAAWGRSKRSTTFDYVCLGFDEHTHSIIGGLYVDGMLRQVCSVNGLTNAQKQDHMKRQRELVGQVFEAKGAKVYSSGALREPRFLKWRDDKSAVECVL